MLFCPIKANSSSTPGPIKFGFQRKFNQFGIAGCGTGETSYMDSGQWMFNAYDWR